jgi:hypothetical protein
MTGSSKRSEPSHVTSRPSVVYNLERGAEHAPPPSRVRHLAGAIGNLFVGGLSWQTIIVWLVLLTLLIGAIVEFAGNGLITAWLRRMNSH